MIEFVDLKAQYDAIKPEIDAAMQRVIENTSFILGEEVAAFEQAFARFLNVEYVIGVSSGTAALYLGLLASGVKAGDEVITSPFTFIATAEAITHVGAKPVFVDIEPDTFNIDVSKVEAAITDKTKAIIPIHLYGYSADMDPIMKLANDYDLKVIEDAAQAHGAEYKNQRVGSIGDIACFSFYPSKNLGAYGDAGAISTNDKQKAQILKKLRNHGRQQKYEHEMVGYGERLDALQAAILRAKLIHLDEWIRSRRRIADMYQELLSNLPIELPTEMPDKRHVYHLYVVRTDKRDKLFSYLKDHDIGVGIHYPIPLHLQPAYRGLGNVHGDFPEAEKAAGEVISLPMYPELSDSDIAYVAQAVNNFFQNSR